MVDVDVDKLHRDFWQSFRNKIGERSGTPLYVGQDMDLTQNYLPQIRNLPRGINYSFVNNTNQGYLQVKLHIWDRRDDRDEIFTYLSNHRDEIESRIGESLNWGRNVTYDFVILQRDGNIKLDRDRWDEYQEWFIEYGEDFDEVFRFYLENRFD